MSQQQQPQVFPHLRLVELYNDGVLYEVAIIKADKDNGDLYYIRIDHLDEIDRMRMRSILLKRDAARYALWDLLDQRTLPNGMNGLDYFHQYVMVRSASGKHFRPQLGRMGAGIKRTDVEKQLKASKKKAAEAPAQEVADAE